MKGSGAQCAKIRKKFQFREEATLKICKWILELLKMVSSKIGVTIWVQAVCPQKKKPLIGWPS